MSKANFNLLNKGADAKVKSTGAAAPLLFEKK